MSVEESEVRKVKHGELTIDLVLSALKQGLKGQFDQDKINKAIGDLGSDKAWFEAKKLQLKQPEDMLRMEWGGVLFEVGLPMTEEEVTKVVQTAVEAIRPEQTQSSPSLTSEDVLEPSGSAIDLVTEDDIMKVIEDLKVETDNLSVGQPEATESLTKQ